MNSEDLRTFEAVPPIAEERLALDAAIGSGTYVIDFAKRSDGSVIDCTVRKVRPYAREWSTQFTADSIEPQVRAVWQELLSRISSSMQRPQQQQQPQSAIDLAPTEEQLRRIDALGLRLEWWGPGLASLTARNASPPVAASIDLSTVETREAVVAQWEAIIRMVDGKNAQQQRDASTHELLQFFETKHLPPHLQLVSGPFGELARRVANGPLNSETVSALRKLIEAKDCAVRAVLMKPRGAP